ncbi:hypothetical protein ABW20_dc0104012 [Dactylellina cionopaga]|nr:hypothetical protein ABW20_dc0104012 [Dactylellina cionopaga]
MRFSPSDSRRFSLPTFDLFGQPIFEPYLYYSQFHHYPPPPPPPPPSMHETYGYSLEAYFNIPETLPEEYCVSSSPDTNTHPNSPPTSQYLISREISPDASSNTSPSSHNSSFSFAESIPSFDVSRTETPGDCCYYELERAIADMVVQTIPHPDSVISPQYDGSAPARRKQSVAAMAPMLDASQIHQKQRPAGRALVVNGSTNDLVPTKAPKTPKTPKAVTVRTKHEKPPQTTGGEAEPPTKPPAQQTQVAVPTTNPSNVPETPTKPTENTSHETAPVPKHVTLPESEHIHIPLSHLPHENPLNSIRLRANYTATADKAKLRRAARTVIQAALQSCEATKEVQIGSWFSWSEKGVSINFKSQEQRWIATDNDEWLAEIGPNVRISEKWAGIVIRSIWNPYILENTVLDDDLKRKLEKLNPMEVAVDGNDDEIAQEPYRIRKIRWFGPSTIAIWFHSVVVADYFSQKHVWFMEGYIGHSKSRSLGVCGLSSVFPLIDAPRKIGMHAQGHAHIAHHNKG